MASRMGLAFGLTLLGVSASQLGACGGKSEQEGENAGGTAGTTSGSSGSGAVSATGGTGTGGNGRGGGVNGGAGGTSAGTMGMPRGGGSGLGGAMSGGSAGSSVAVGCDWGDMNYEDGDQWASDCNTCFCNRGQVSCTTIACNPASGGMGGSAGSGTGGDAGDAGEPGAPPDCSADLGSLCIEGTPTDGGHALEVGMPLVLSMRPAGCFSSSCTKLVESSCNYIGSTFDFYVSGFFCLTSEGDACTDDCGGAPTTSCDLDMTLAAGEYTIGLSGTPGALLSKLSFTVPGVVLERDRCTHEL